MESSFERWTMNRMARLLVLVAAMGSACKGTGTSTPPKTILPAVAPTDAAPTTPTETTPPAMAPADAAPADPAALLAVLRQSLDRVHAAAPEETIRLGEPQEVSGLAGATQAEIRAALGDPQTCTENMQFAPCVGGDPTSWFYSFYHLETGSLGGGPELLLEFEANGRCTRARWAHTR